MIMNRSAPPDCEAMPNGLPLKIFNSWVSAARRVEGEGIEEVVRSMGTKGLIWLPNLPTSVLAALRCLCPPYYKRARN